MFGHWPVLLCVVLRYYKMFKVIFLILAVAFVVLYLTRDKSLDAEKERNSDLC